MILYLDLVSGIAGDMALGALVDLGVPPDWLRQKLSPILSGFELRTEIVFPQHLRAVNLHVDVTDTTTHRQYTDIREMIGAADLPETVRNHALTAFGKIAGAEAHIHGKEIDQVHFHEIGGIDSLVDIIGTFLALDYLGITRVTASKIPLGSGFIECAHGRIPVPVPATMAVLKGLPVIPSDARTEIVTPTGAAIVATLAEDFGPMPEMMISGIGYGAGKRETGASVPNILRMVLGKPVNAEHTHIRRDRVMTIRTNVDDAAPEILGFAMERLMAAGALDVSFIPAAMKKNRPGTLVEVLCKPEDLDSLAGILFRETTAIGLRYFSCDRMVLRRKPARLDLGEGLGEIRVKQVTDPDGRDRILPEYEACREKARTLGLPLKEIYGRVASAARCGANPLDTGQARLYKTDDGKS